MPTLTGAERTRLGPQLDDIKKRQFALKKQAKLKYETSPNNNLDYLLEGKNLFFHQNPRRQKFQVSKPIPERELRNACKRKNYGHQVCRLERTIPRE